MSFKPALLGLLLVPSIALAAEPGTTLGTSASPPDHPEYGRVLAERSASVVTVKAVLQVKSGGSGDRATEVEVPGFVVDTAGLIVCSSTMLGGSGPRMGSGSTTVVPTELKVIVGGDNDGMDAKLLARDSELDLAWIQTKAPPDRKLVAVDASLGTPPAPGDDLLLLARMPKQFGRMPVVFPGQLSGVSTKPRPLLLVTGDLMPGMPLFSRSGAFVGLSILNVSDEEERGRGARHPLQNRFSVVGLPAAEFVKAIARARQPMTAETQ